ncbi:hypothetical protein NXA99_07405 [Citrobacter amalonaticus]|uniref:hypothetical protein n=1 Tax=Citrobacter amalonaticus TaxID=35703 RepID=UPI00215B9BE0|nr:hypothetical protein [Citrobacter amalonaticus]MCR9028359.1 hypothetical protein [Citrobacter amalonaticus]
MQFTKEQLIERCRGEIECAQITIRNGTSDTPNAVAERLELFEIALASLTAEPIVTFYSDGIVAAATWVDQQREHYNSEHGRHDPDTGTFEFSNDAQRDYSATLEEIAEGIRALHPNSVPPAPVVPDRYIFEKWWESQNGTPLDGWDSLRTTDGYCDDGIDGQFDAWNACRAAMLQGEAEQPQNSQQNIPKNIPEGYALVPIEPTESMIVDGFESEPDKFFSKPEEWKAYEAMSGCQQAAHRAKICWAAMLAAAPKPE